MKITIVSLMLTATTSAFMVVPSNPVRSMSKLDMTDEPEVDDEGAPFFIASDEIFEEEEPTTVTKLKNPFAAGSTSFKAPKVDTSKVKDWLTDFANSKEGEAALDGLKSIAGIVGDVSLELAKGVGKTVGNSLKDLKESKQNAKTMTTDVVEEPTTTTAFGVTTTPPTAATPSFSYLDNLETLEESEEYYDESDEEGFAP